jgi:hypothetical protein
MGALGKPRDMREKKKILAKGKVTRKEDRFGFVCEGLCQSTARPRTNA